MESGSSRRLRTYSPLFPPTTSTSFLQAIVLALRVFPSRDSFNTLSLVRCCGDHNRTWFLSDGKLSNDPCAQLNPFQILTCIINLVLVGSPKKVSKLKMYYGTFLRQLGITEWIKVSIRPHRFHLLLEAGKSSWIRISYYI
jgi:hypothetical protein